MPSRSGPTRSEATRSERRLEAIKAARARVAVPGEPPAGVPAAMAQRERPRAVHGALRDRPASRWRPLAAGLVGFMAGVVFWHFVGFWSFVNEAVLHGGPVAGERGKAARYAKREAASPVSMQASTTADDICAGQAPAEPCSGMAALTEAAARRWAAGETLVREPTVAGWTAQVRDDAALVSAPLKPAR